MAARLPLARQIDVGVQTLRHRRLGQPTVLIMRRPLFFFFQRMGINAMARGERGAYCISKY